MAQCTLIHSLDQNYDAIVIEKLKKHGFSVSEIFFSAAKDINLKNTDAVVICGGENCRAGLASHMDAYLKKGGNLIVLGGPPFATEYYPEAGNKRTEDLALLFAEGGYGKRICMDFSNPLASYGFVPNTENPDSKKVEVTATIAIEQDKRFHHRLTWHSDHFAINESFEAPFSLQKDENVIGFYAKADENTCTITVKLIDCEGNVFKARITPEQEYRFFMLSSRDFIYDGNRYTPFSWRRNNIILDMEKVVKIQFGHALSHAYSVAGNHTFHIAEVSAGNIPFLNTDKIHIDGLCPKYKFFPLHNAVSVRISPRQTILPQNSNLSLYQDMFSFAPRPQGLGLDNGRRMRFVPLIEVIGEDGLLSGFLAYLLFNRTAGSRNTEYDGSSISAFTVNDPAFYLNGGAELVAQTVSAMLCPVMLIEGGTDEFIYRDDRRKGEMGAVCSVKPGVDFSHYHVQIQATNIMNCDIPLSAFQKIKESEFFHYYRFAIPFEAHECNVSVSLFYDNTCIDTLSHNVLIHHVKPEKNRHYAKIAPGQNEIEINGKTTRFFGVNYMPSYDIANNDFQAFEHYVSAFSYDPDVIDIDLQRIRAIGLNAVSIFTYYDPSLSSNNILHLIDRCEHYGLYVNLSLRPHANPFDFSKQEVQEMIETYRLDQIDTIVGYDIAWERYVGTYEPCYGNMNGRKSFDADWRFFLKNRYGSFEKAETLFGCSLPRDDAGKVIGLPDDMLREDGLHNKMVAAYRRCIDHAVRRAHIAACDCIHAFDSNHLISARSGDASTIPLVDPGIYGYDYDAMSAALDTVSPESYALSDDYKSIRQGVFTNIYARYANPDNVVQWMEFGKSIWTGSNFTQNQKMRSFQGEYYRRFFEMLLTGHTAGMFCWWFAGGYRIGENSDFGILDPDGGERPVTQVLREYAPKFIGAPSLPKADRFIEIDRDLHADGLRSVYRSIEDELFTAINEGQTVAFIDGGTGTTSANVSLVEVGNISPHGCSPKFLDGIITSVLLTTQKRTLSVTNGSTILLDRDEELSIQVLIQNTSSAKWLSGEGMGSVHFVSSDDSNLSFRLPLPSPLEKRERIRFTVFAGKISGKITGMLTALNRTVFGDRLDLNIIRE